MGGRRSYSIKTVLGDLRQSIPERRALGKAMEKGDAEKVVSATVSALMKSDLALSNLSHLVAMAGIFKETEGKDIPASELRGYVTNYWIKSKKEKGIDSSTEADSSIIDSAVHALKQRGRS